LVDIVNDKGIIICDESNEKLLRSQLRKSRAYNPVQSLSGEEDNTCTQNIIEDITHRKSSLSHFIQTVDVIAHVLYRKEFPKGFLKNMA